MKVSSTRRAFYEKFQVRPEETVGRSLFELGDRHWVLPELRAALDAVLLQDRPFNDFILERDFPRVGPMRVILKGRGILGNPEQDWLVLLVFEPAIDIPKGSSTSATR